MSIALTRIPGIGPSTAKILIENGFKSAQQLADSTIAQLAAVPGFGAARASRTINAAIASLSVSGGAAGKAAIPQTAARQRRTLHTEDNRSFLHTAMSSREKNITVHCCARATFHYELCDLRVLTLNITDARPGSASKQLAQATAGQIQLPSLQKFELGGP